MGGGVFPRFSGQTYAGLVVGSKRRTWGPELSIQGGFQGGYVRRIPTGEVFGTAYGLGLLAVDPSLRIPAASDSVNLGIGFIRGSGECDACFLVPHPGRWQGFYGVFPFIRVNAN